MLWTSSPWLLQYCTHLRVLNQIHHDNVHHLTADVSIHRDPLVMVRTPRPKFQATKARRTSTWIHPEDNRQTLVVIMARPIITDLVDSSPAGGAPAQSKDTPHLCADSRVHLYQVGLQKIVDNLQTLVARSGCGSKGLIAIA